MKKLSFLFVILVMASVTFLVSCGTDSETTPPTIMLNAAPGYVGTDITVPVDTTLKIGVITQSTSAKLTKFEIIQTVNGASSTLWDTTFVTPVDSYNDTYNITAPPVVGSVTLTFKITAADGEFASASFIITTTSAPIYTYTAVLMGGQENANAGSFYSTQADSVMKIAAARQNSEKIDLVYYYGQTNHSSIVAVSDAQLTDVPAFAECATWTTRNATVFKLTTGVDWASITNESGILANATGMTVTHINSLAVGDIVAFETASTSNNPSKKGMYKVMEINGATGADRTIKIEVKIQQ
jgi:hypothetical protein